jgi:hypothetical protein
MIDQFINLNKVASTLKSAADEAAAGAATIASTPARPDRAAAFALFQGDRP